MLQFSKQQLLALQKSLMYLKKRFFGNSNRQFIQSKSVECTVINMNFMKITSQALKPTPTVEIIEFMRANIQTTVDESENARVEND